MTRGFVILTKQFVFNFKEFVIKGCHNFTLDHIKMGVWGNKEIISSFKLWKAASVPTICSRLHVHMPFILYDLNSVF